MKIGIDLRPLQEYSRFRGIGIVTFQITKALLNNYPKEEYYFYLYENLPPPNINEILNRGKVVRFDKNGKDYVIDNLLRKKPSISENIDVFLASDPNKKMPTGKFKKVVIFYDIIHLLFTQQYLETPTKYFDINIVKFLKLLRFKLVKRFMVKNLGEAVAAGRILAISERTKKDITSYFNVSEGKVSVLYLAADADFKKMNNINPDFLSQKYSVNTPYILYVGGLDSRKNVLNLARAVSILEKNKKFPYQLVIIGKDVIRKNMPENMELRKFLDKESLWNKLKLIDFVPQDDLIKFYNLAEVFVFPSIYEGFGLPVLEAMQCGTPTAISDISSLKEVADKAAIYFNPDNPTDIANKIYLLLKNKSFRQELSNKGLQQSKNFSWEKASRIVYESFKK